MRLLRILAFPLALLYGMGIYIRNALYDMGWLRSTAFQTKTISVGNLSTGGTGKTPMIEWLITQLPGSYKVAVVTRGYGRKTSEPISAKTEHSSEEIGDEPKQLISKFPDLCLRVDRDRRRAIQWLEANVKPDIILLDDAHQHRRISPHKAIILTTYANLYSDDYFLPTGNLRDSRKEARRADSIIVTKCPDTMTSVQQEEVVSKLKPASGQEIYFAGLQYSEHLTGANPMSLQELKEHQFTLATGIAQPRPLVEYLKSRDLKFTHLAFPDHHHFSKKEVEKFKSIDFLVLTEKDYARVGHLVPKASYLGVKHKFLGEGRTRLLEHLGIRKQNASI